MAAPTRPDGLPAGDALRSARLVAGTGSALEAVVLVGFCGFYLWEIVQGESGDATRAAMGALLIAVMAAALALLAIRWFGVASWVRTPTLVWNALLLPVAWTLVRGDQVLAGIALALVAGTCIVAAVRAGPGADPLL